MNMKKLILIAILLLPCLAFGQNTLVVNPDSKPVPVKNVSGTPLATAETVTSNLNNGQVAAAITAGTLVVARPTRISCVVKNTDAAIIVYVGKATVTAANGYTLKPGESHTFTYTGLIQVIAASGTPAIAIWDEYN